MGQGAGAGQAVTPIQLQTSPPPPPFPFGAGPAGLAEDRSLEPTGRRPGPVQLLWSRVGCQRPGRSEVHPGDKNSPRREPARGIRSVLSSSSVL